MEEMETLAEYQELDAQYGHLISIQVMTDLKGVVCILRLKYEKILKTDCSAAENSIN